MDIQSQLFLKKQIWRKRNQQALRSVQVNCYAHADASGGGAVFDRHIDVQLWISDIGHQRSQRVSTCTVLVIQHLLSILAGHDCHQHLCLQLVVAGQLAGNGLFYLSDLLLTQILFQVHFLDGVKIQLSHVILGIRVDKGHFTGTV